MDEQFINFLELIKGKIKQEEEYCKLKTYLEQNEFKVYFEVYKNLIELYEKDSLKDDDTFYSVRIFTDNKSPQDIDDNTKKLIKSHNNEFKNGSKAIVYASIGTRNNNVYPIRVNNIVDLLSNDGISCCLQAFYSFFNIENYNTTYKPNGIIVSIKSNDFKNLLESVTKANVIDQNIEINNEKSKIKRSANV